MGGCSAPPRSQGGAESSMHHPFLRSFHLLTSRPVTPITPHLHTFSPATQDTHYTDEKGNVRVRLNSHMTPHISHTYPHTYPLRHRTRTTLMRRATCACA